MKKKLLFCMFFVLFLLVGFLVMDFDYKVINSGYSSLEEQAKEIVKKENKK